MAAPKALRQKIIIAALDDDRKFTVTLLDDGTWLFRYTNGDPIPNEFRSKYCTQIAGAQEQIETEYKWQRRGRGIALTALSRQQPIEGASVSTDNINYFPAGRSALDPTTCRLASRVDLDFPR